mmetsp:Transcript_10908/g.13615  ORF Transcript_10908/g.13615 Transcript_10908/m.13615 type:complete len:162 (+) Transcript_10908:2-487(+)
MLITYICVMYILILTPAFIVSQAYFLTVFLLDHENKQNIYHNWEFMYLLITPWILVLFTWILSVLWYCSRVEFDREKLRSCIGIAFMIVKATTMIFNVSYFILLYAIDKISIDNHDNLEMANVFIVCDVIGIVLLVSLPIIHNILNSNAKDAKDMVREIQI